MELVPDPAHAWPFLAWCCDRTAGQVGGLGQDRPRPARSDAGLPDRKDPLSRCFRRGCHHCRGQACRPRGSSADTSAPLRSCRFGCRSGVGCRTSFDRPVRKVVTLSVPHFDRCDVPRASPRACRNGPVRSLAGRFGRDPRRGYRRLNIVGRPRPSPHAPSIGSGSRGRQNNPPRPGRNGRCRSAGS